MGVLLNVTLEGVGTGLPYRLSYFVGSQAHAETVKAEIEGKPRIYRDLDAADQFIRSLFLSLGLREEE